MQKTQKKSSRNISAAKSIVRQSAKNGGAGGYLVGRSHTNGGIKVKNKSTGENLEVQGGEVVITKPAVEDQSVRTLTGTNKEILSQINVGGGGVGFAKGGRVPKKIRCKGTMYMYGGKMMSDYDIVKSCGCKHSKQKMAKGGKIGIKHQRVINHFAQFNTPLDKYIGKYVKYNDPSNPKFGTIAKELFQIRHVQGLYDRKLGFNIIAITFEGKTDHEFVNSVANSFGRAVSVDEIYLVNKKGLKQKKQFTEKEKNIFVVIGKADHYEKGGHIKDQKLLDDISAMDLPAGYIMYKGHPEELLKFIQEQVTGMDHGRKSVHTDFIGFKSLQSWIPKDIILRSVEIIPQHQKDMIIKAWKGKALDPELRKALKNNTMKNDSYNDFKVKPPKKLYRGIMHNGQGAGTYMLGKGLYSTTDKKWLKQFKYDEIIELNPLFCFPKNPLVLNAHGNIYGAFNDWLLKESGEKRISHFNDKYPDPSEFVKSKGYDGVIVGEEIVKYDIVEDRQYKKGGQTSDIPEIVKRAMTNTVTHIGQISKDDLYQLNKYVKKGVLIKGKGGGFPKLKTVYAIKGFDIQKDREDQLQEMFDEIERLEPGTIKYFKEGGNVEQPPSMNNSEAENIDIEIERQRLRFDTIKFCAIISASNTVRSYHIAKPGIVRLLAILLGFEKDIKEYNDKIGAMAMEHSDNTLLLSEQISIHTKSFNSRNHSYSIDEYDSSENEKLCVDARKFSDQLKTLTGKEADLWGHIFSTRVIIINQLEEFIQLCEELKAVEENILPAIGIGIEDINVTGKNYDSLNRSIKERIEKLEGEKLMLHHKAEVEQQTGIEIGSEVPIGTDERLSELSI